MSAATRVLARFAGLPPVRTKVRVDRDLRIPMPDGVELLADRWFPTGADGSRAPIVLTRTPYGRVGVFGLLFRMIAERGYQVVVVSCRGTFGCGGDWVPFRNEEADGQAVLSWLEEQPWFVDNVVTAGASYFGLTQWAVAGDPPPWLKAMAPAITSSWFRDIIYTGNSFTLESMLIWLHELEYQERSFTTRLRTQLSLRRTLAPAFATVPLADADVTAVGRHVDWYQDWLAHDEPGDPWWTPIDFGRTLDRTPPMSMVAGWYDLFLPYQLADYKKLRAAGRPARLLVGPWRHAQPQTVAAFLRDTVEWADVHLRGMAPARPSDVRVFLMGADEWVDLTEWPPPSTPTRYHLHAGGELRTDAPPASSPDRYRYDPADPTPSVGGASLSRKAGARDNRKREARADVLTYTTPPLPRDVTIVGEVTAELFVRSSLDHTDFVVRLCDVAPDGKSLNISDGVVRLRPGDVQRQPDGSLKVVISMFPTAIAFRHGHRIRLQVSSGAHPLYVRNPGSGEPLGKATTFIPAEQEVLHDADHPSAIVLPRCDARLTA